jgi:hypothetical protein
MFLMSTTGLVICPVLAQLLDCRFDKRKGMRLEDLDQNYVPNKKNMSAKPNEIKNAAIYKYNDSAKRYLPVPGTRG